tara:strand:- start:335 stop:1813 length:1479 start_codon:yes stop_codon:yes gene_type:complete
MAKKFESVGNYLIVTDTVTLTSTEYPKRHIKYRDYDNEIIITDINSKADSDSFYFSDIVDYNGVPFADLQTFLAFLRANTANFSSVDSSLTLNNRVVVNQQNKDYTIGGIINSSKEYFVDGIIDMGTTQITIPVTGITIKGYSFNGSALTSGENNYTMFVSETALIGSGDVLAADLYLTTSGTGSKVFDLYDSNGLHAFEFERVNFMNCSSLGDIHGYRQGLEIGTGRFGGSPSLTLHGNWIGGYRITTSIARSLESSMTEPLFKAGTSFQMNNRFLTDINCDLPTLASFCDFSASDFPNPSTVQIRGSIISRNGAYNSSDSNIFPNLSFSSLSSSFYNNTGINNTHEGAIITSTSEVETVITSIGVKVPVDGVFATSSLQHYDSPSSGELRHIGESPHEYLVTWDIVLVGLANNDYSVHIMRSINGGAFSEVKKQTRVINNFSGNRDVAHFTGTTAINLGLNDSIRIYVSNISSTANCTLETDSEWIIVKR